MKIAKTTISLILTFLMVLTLLFVPTASVSAAETQKKEWKTFEELVDEKGYLNGIQQPWLIRNSTGNDIGSSALFSYSATNYNDDMWYEVFRNCKAMGFEIVQLWITYMLGGILFDNEWNVVGIEPGFKKNFPRVLEIAEECGVYIAITLIEHSEEAFPAQHASGDTKNARYEEIYRFMHNEKGTELFVENWLKPVLEMTKKHENIIMANLFAEPEANGGRWGVQTGSSWENVERFLKTLNDTVHEVNPRLFTYAGATKDVKETFKHYQDIDMDCYGYDYYAINASDASLDVATLFLDKPLVYGEFGISDESASYTLSDEYMTAYFNNYFEKIEEMGVEVGFYWYYGFPAVKRSIVDSKSRIRPFAWAIRSWALDNEYARTGYEGIDTPTFMYSTSENIRWFGSRGATKIMLQRSKDGKTGWKTVLSFDPDDSKSVQNYEYASMMYEWLDPEVKEGETWSYRAIAADNEGNERISEPITITADIVTCSEEDNLIKNGGFEKAPLKLRSLTNGSYSDGEEGWQVANQSHSQYDLVHYLDGSQAHSGNGSVYRVTRLFQEVTLKPDTDYTLTFFYKYTMNGGVVYFVSDYPVNSAPDPKLYMNGLIDKFELLDKHKNIGWVRHTIKFNSGDITKTHLMFYAWHGGANQKDETNVTDWHIDDVYLFETKK